jgi:hypothetical protein
METIKIVLLLSLLCVVSCNKSNENKSIMTCYDETKASDPWTKSENDTELIANVKKYLSDSILVFEISISSDGTFETCKAASCKTGRRIRAKISSNDLSKITKLRFYECQ